MGCFTLRMAILPLTDSVTPVWSCGNSWFTVSGRSWTHFSQWVNRSCLLISPPISSSPQKAVTLTRADRGFPTPPRTSHRAPSLPSPTLTLRACISFLLCHCKDYVRKVCVMCIKLSVRPPAQASTPSVTPLLFALFLRCCCRMWHVLTVTHADGGYGAPGWVETPTVCMEQRVWAAPQRWPLLLTSWPRDSHHALPRKSRATAGPGGTPPVTAHLPCAAGPGAPHPTPELWFASCPTAQHPASIWYGFRVTFVECKHLIRILFWTVLWTWLQRVKKHRNFVIWNIWYEQRLAYFFLSLSLRNV